MSSTEPGNGPGFACSLSPAELTERAASLLRLAAEARAVRSTEDGLVLVFESADAVAARLLDLVLAERRCCPTFRFALVFDPHLGPLRLHLDGPGEATGPVHSLLTEKGAVSG